MTGHSVQLRSLGKRKAQHLRHGAESRGPGTSCSTLRGIGMGRPTVTERDLLWSGERARLFHEKIAPYVHPSLDYKLHPDFRGRFAWDARETGDFKYGPHEPYIAPARRRSCGAPLPQASFERRERSAQPTQALRPPSGRESQLPGGPCRCPQLAGDAARWARTEVLRVAAARHPADRDAEGRHRGGRQPRAREGRQEQGRGAVPSGRVRHRVR